MGRQRINIYAPLPYYKWQKLKLNLFPCYNLGLKLVRWVPNIWCFVGPDLGPNQNCNLGFPSCFIISTNVFIHFCWLNKELSCWLSTCVFPLLITPIFVYISMLLSLTSCRSWLFKSCNVDFASLQLHCWHQMYVYISICHLWQNVESSPCVV